MNKEFNNINKQELIKYQKMINDIPELANYKKKYQTLSTIGVAAILFVFIGPIILSFLNKNQMFFINQGYIFGGFFVIMIFIIAAAAIHGKYTSIYKKQIINKLLVERGFSYSESGMPSTEYDKGHYESYDRYSSDDLVKGSINGIPFELFDVHTEDKYTDNDGHTHYSTIFDGSVVRSFLTKNSNLLIDIVPNALFKGKKYVPIDNDEFEKVFDVHSSDEIQAVRLLSPDVTMNILDLRKSLGVDLDIKVINNVIYFRFYNGGLFEPCISNSKKEAERISAYFHMLESIQKIIESIAKEMESLIDG